MSQEKIYRGIASIKNEKSLVEFTNKLQVAELSQFSRLLGEKSKIGIVIQDYSKGTGKENIIVEANILPEEALGLLERAKAIVYYGGKGDFQDSWVKTFGEYEDEHGKKDGNAIVTKLMISRRSTDSSGKPMRYPWNIQIENGKGKMAEGKNALVSGTYVCLKKAYKQVSDEDLIGVLIRVSSCIREFEHHAASVLFDPALYQLKTEQDAWKRNK